MEGSLLKWTNYLSGWQRRYFVLDQGILSYYDSQDDVGKASKGSIKMAVCEIRVHHSDSCRMDLFIPSEQSFYLCAENAADRQRWLVALGSAKACLGDITTQYPRESLSNKESLGHKLLELRQFCDRLMEQMVEVQGAVHSDELRTATNMAKVHSSYSVLQGTCSHMSLLLDECLKYVNPTLQPLTQNHPLPPGDIASHRPQSRKVNPVEPPPSPHSVSGSQIKGGIQTVTKNIEQMAFRLHTLERRYSPSSNGASLNEGCGPNNLH